MCKRVRVVGLIGIFQMDALERPGSKRTGGAGKRGIKLMNSRGWKFPKDMTFSVLFVSGSIITMNNLEYRSKKK